MSVLMEQHERWSEARERLWKPARRERIEPPAPRPEPVKPKPMTVLSPLVANGWPVYQKPVAYDHCDGYVVTPVPSWRRIAREVCTKHGVSMEELMSPRRNRFVVAARHEVFWRCKHETSMSFPQIGQRFGGKDHTTVLHGIKQHEKRLAAARVAAYLGEVAHA
jgi:hypothetical protein